MKHSEEKRKWEFTEDILWFDFNGEVCKDAMKVSLGTSKEDKGWLVNEALVVNE